MLPIIIAAIVIALIVFGWWLLKLSRALDRLANVLAVQEVDLGFLGYQGKPSAVLLFADVRFVIWLMLRKYRTEDFPAPVDQALDEARMAYLLIVATFFFIGVAAILVEMML